MFIFEYLNVISFLLCEGDLYAVGSNSRNVYICQTSSNLSTNGEETNPQDANIVKTFAKHHKGSIYCLR